MVPGSCITAVTIWALQDGHVIATGNSLNTTDMVTAAGCVAITVVVVLVDVGAY